MHFYQVMAVVCWLKGNNLMGQSNSTYALKGGGGTQESVRKRTRGGGSSKSVRALV